MISRSLDQTVGPKFLHIDNHDLLSAFSNAASNAGADLDTRQAFTSTSGLILTADLPDYTIDSPELGGKITPRLWLKNLNNGRSAMSVGIGFYRFVCMNGLYIGVNMFGAKLIHRDGPKAHSILDLLPESLNTAMGSIKSGAATDLLLDAAEQKVIDPIDVIGSLNINKTAKARAIYIVAAERNRWVDDPKTAWGLYNIVNEQVNRATRSKFAAAERDMGLLENIQFLADNQVKVA